jgi:predicted negative regulator of RcsB-dependent stress response
MRLLPGRPPYNPPTENRTDTMASHLDLEEQEQLDQLRHFWSRWGNLITGALIVVFGALAAWNGYQYWERRQSAQASLLYDEVERAVAAGDTARVERSFTDMRDKFGGTAYAQQAALSAGKLLFEKNKPDQAKAALRWVAEKGDDAGMQAVARLRLAAVLAASKSYDEALRELQSPFPESFVALAADRRGDILQLQGKKTEAVAEYRRAYAGLEGSPDYQRVVELKLNALGVDPQADAVAASGKAKAA